MVIPPLMLLENNVLLVKLVTSLMLELVPNVDPPQVLPKLVNVALVLI